METTKTLEAAGATFLVTVAITNNVLPEEQKSNALLTAKEVGRMLALHPDTVRRMARIGELAAVKVGKREVRFERSVVEAWKLAHR
jgi:excisionase family DNA binding protein